MNLPSPDMWQIGMTIATPFLLYVAAVKAVIPIWLWCGHKASRAGDLVAVFIGRPQSFDRVTGKESEAVPSLVEALVQIRDKQGEQGKEIRELTTVVHQVADQQVTLSEHTRQINDLRLASAIHAEQIGILKLAATERAATANAAAAALNLVRDEQTANAEQKPETH